MSDDLAKLLREEAEIMRAMKDYRPLSRLLNKAADEIDRLRAVAFEQADRIAEYRHARLKIE